MKVFFTDKKVKYEYNKACKIVIKKNNKLSCIDMTIGYFDDDMEYHEEIGELPDGGIIIEEN